MSLVVDIQFTDVSQPPPQRVTGWRFLHCAEGSPRQNPLNMPEIRNASNDFIVTEMTRGVQLLAWGVMTEMNSLLNKNKYQDLHSYNRAMNNGPQNGYLGGQDHADWINATNLTASNPRYDKTRGYGGQMIQGYDEGKYIRVVPGIHCIDPKNLPTVQEVIDNNWYSLAVNVNPNNTVSDFAQGQGGVIAYLWISKSDALFPRTWFQWWDSTERPDYKGMYVTPSLFQRVRMLFSRKVST